MSVDYLHLQPEQVPPHLARGAFRRVIVAEVGVGEGWREQIASECRHGRSAKIRSRVGDDGRMELPVRRGETADLRGSSRS